MENEEFNLLDITRFKEAKPGYYLYAIGGIPIRQENNDYYLLNTKLNESIDGFYVINKILVDSVGASAVLTHGNKSNKTLTELGIMCSQKRHEWANNWINVSLFLSFETVEELTTGEFHLWQIDNPNDIDQKNQMVIISEQKINKIKK